MPVHFIGERPAFDVAIECVLFPDGKVCVRSISCHCSHRVIEDFQTEGYAWGVLGAGEVVRPLVCVSRLAKIE